jgi:type IV secretory pathway VirB4 component
MAGHKEKIQASTQAYLPISEIKEGVVTMKDGSLRAVILVSSLNFALKSDQEKDAIIVSYQDFLNSLSFPIQIVASSRKIDLSNYLKTISDAAAGQTNPLVRLQAENYHKFLTELLEHSNIMEKRFFVIVPFYPSGVDISAIPSPLKQQSHEPTIPFKDQKNNLMQRVEVVIAGLSSVGLRCVALGTEDLLELYYSIYNPDVSRNQKVGGVQDVDIPLISQQNGAI